MSAVTTKEKIEVMQAFADGKEIERKYVIDGNWEDCISPDWDWVRYTYRIKKGPEYIPFDNTDELIKANRCSRILWIKEKGLACKQEMVLAYDYSVVHTYLHNLSLTELFRDWETADGKPLGKLVDNS